MHFLAHGTTTIIPSSSSSSPSLTNRFCTLTTQTPPSTFCCRQSIRSTKNKTTALLHTVHWARHSGWLVLHVSDGKEVVEGGYWVRPSEVTDGDFDQPQVAMVTD